MIKIPGTLLCPVSYFPSAFILVVRACKWHTWQAWIIINKWYALMAVPQMNGSPTEKPLEHLVSKKQSPGCGFAKATLNRFKLHLVCLYVCRGLHPAIYQKDGKTTPHLRMENIRPFPLVHVVTCIALLRSIQRPRIQTHWSNRVFVWITSEDRQKARIVFKSQMTKSIQVRPN